MKFHTLRIIEVVKETDQCVSVAFDVPAELQETFSYVPGQYLTLQAEIGGENVRRSYSICSHRDEPLRVAIKEVPGGVFSTWANEHLAAGQDIDSMPPQGNFTHEPVEENVHHYVAFAAGSGITPVMSIMSQVLSDEPKSTFTLFYGNYSAQHIIFKEKIESMKNKYMTRLQVHHLFSDEITDSPLLSERIEPRNLASYFKYFVPYDTVHKVFLCGPYQMIIGLRDALPDVGVSPDRVKFELFFNPETAGASEGAQEKVIADHETTITITLDGVTSELVSRYDQSILDIAVDAGLDLPFACKGGVCATCKAKRISGDIDMKTNFALEDEEVEQGYILTCQSHVQSEVAEITFDM